MKSSISLQPIIKSVRQRSYLICAGSSIILWAVASFTIIPSEQKSRARFLDTLVQSHHSSLKVFSTQKIRDELTRHHFIPSDSAIEQYSYSYEPEKISSFLNTCSFVLPSICSNSKQIVILVGGTQTKPVLSDAVLVLESDFLSTYEASLLWALISVLFSGLLVLVCQLNSNSALLRTRHKFGKIEEEIRKYRSWLSQKTFESQRLNNLAHTAHDIRSPLEEIMDSHKQLPLMVKSFSSEKLSSTLESMNIQVEMVLDKFEKALKYHKVPKGRNVISSSILKFVDNANQSSKLGALLFTCAVSPELDLVEFDFDETTFQECLMGLAANAVEASAQNIYIETELSSQNNHLCTILFSDDGTGISDSFRSKLFLEYATSKPTGTGLGLASIKTKLKSSNADIVLLDSEEGAMFLLTIPTKKVMPDA